MSVIDEIRRDRETWRGFSEGTGIRKLVEDLYPDSAHFIYELLQDAEDTAASEARFRSFKDEPGLRAQRPPVRPTRYRSNHRHW